MAVCPRCSRAVPESSAACPHCSAPLVPVERVSADVIQAANDPDITRPAPQAAASSPSPAAPASPRSPASPTSSGGRRQAGVVEPIDHERFAPGTILAERYRMIGRLGSGGMGEVYRADDLKLGQPVALKFLPEAVDRDPSRLTQLHSEVRIARQISHPHVCRVYDIDEYEGHTFLSMEYVDGEDLASLLRRVGRLGQTRAVELARQICAGLAAAHDRGVVHRDLKPANIMLDGEGQIRITDFGLAGAIGDSPRAGTPAYMAPEQLAGQEVTPRSDLYALGLVLYELFTGQRALSANNLAELIAKREQVDITPPTEIVRDLDPAIERVILRCLERDPARRPASALAVAAALPGGDPLAAALAAGAMLSPDAVAAAGEESAWALRPAIASMSFVLVGLIALVLLGDRVLITGHVPIDAPAAVMQDRAGQIRQRLGYREPFADSASGFSIESGYLRFIMAGATPEQTVSRVHGRPAPLQLWYRTSPTPLVPTGSVPAANESDPPQLMSGMTSTVIDAHSRLVSFDAVPPQFEAPAQTAERVASSEPDWSVLFAAADLPRDRFTAVAPRWAPPTYADSRAAWEGSLADEPDIKLRLEAAGFHGRVTSFAIIGPWTEATRMTDAPMLTPTQRWASALRAAIIFIVTVAGFLIGRHNVRSGRGDRRAAGRLAFFVFAVDFGRRVLLGSHLAVVTLDIGYVFVNLASSAMLAILTWGLYIALEPFVRRFWPNSLISWTRLLSGHVRDPRVGRDMLLGCAAGTLMALVAWGHNLLPLFAGKPANPPGVPMLEYLNGAVSALATIDRVFVASIFVGMSYIFLVVLLRVLVRRIWLTVVLAMICFSLPSIVSIFTGHPAWLDIASQLTVMAIMGFVVVELGVLSTLVAFNFLFVLQNAPLTADAGKWYFGTSFAIVALFGAVALCAFTWARAGAPIFGRPLLD